MRTCTALIVLLTAAGAPAQESRPELPPVATIDGQAVTRAELVRHLLETNWPAISEALVLEAVLDMELKKAAITASEPGSGWEDLQKRQEVEPGSFEGWPKTQDARQKRFVAERLARYEVSKRGEEPAPPAGLVAEVREREGTESRQVTDDQAVAFLVVRTNPEAIRAAANELVDSLLVDRELARAGKPVTAAEVEAWEASMKRRFPPPFDWRTICQFRSTTPHRERAKWRRREAWKRITGWQIDEKELVAFHEQHRDRLAGSYRVDSRPSAPRDLSDPGYRSCVVDELEAKHMSFWLTSLRAKSRIWIAPDDELAKIRGQ